VAAHGLDILGVEAVISFGCPTQLFLCTQLDTPLQGEAAFLLATDVAARGLDILGVEAVISFGCPTQLFPCTQLHPPHPCRARRHSC
jgi:superfamily II DNA/RNA helicase